jgi:hypothetical protein
MCQKISKGEEGLQEITFAMASKKGTKVHLQGDPVKLAGNRKQCVLYHSLRLRNVV